MRKVLLHICCAVCAFGCIKQLKEEGFSIEGLFFNPNIHPESEYFRRKQALAVVESAADIVIHQGQYSRECWSAVCDKYRDEKEGGRRCLVCYQMRLEETFNFCRRRNMDYFTTTLTVSPHKNSKAIFDIGYKVGGDYFLKRDFKKKEGFKQSQELSREHGIYHQNYCGCLYSMRGNKIKGPKTANSGN
ncbi:MAG: epoxyqueuosine reductase QueH [Candidatus Omnitrophota bacterium]